MAVLNMNDIAMLLRNLPCIIFRRLGLTAPDTCGNVRVIVTGISFIITSSSQLPDADPAVPRRRLLEQVTNGNIVLSLLVEVIDTKSLPPATVQQRLSLEETTQGIAASLAAEAVEAGSDISAGGGGIGSIARTDPTTGAVIEQPKPIAGEMKGQSQGTRPKLPTACRAERRWCNAVASCALLPHSVGLPHALTIL